MSFPRSTNDRWLRLQPDSVCEAQAEVERLHLDVLAMATRSTPNGWWCEANVCKRSLADPAYRHAFATICAKADAKFLTWFPARVAPHIGWFLGHKGTGTIVRVLAPSLEPLIAGMAEVAPVLGYSHVSVCYSGLQLRGRDGKSTLDPLDQALAERLQAAGAAEDAWPYGHIRSFVSRGFNVATNEEEWTMVSHEGDTEPRQVDPAILGKVWSIEVNLAGEPVAQPPSDFGPVS